MPFKIEKRDSYRWTVEHVLSLKDGAPDEMMKLDVAFKALDAKAAGEAAKLASTDPKKFFELVLVGWYDAPEGWDFSLEKFEELCVTYPGISSSFARAYFDSVIGTARKN